ncbi:MAG: hypothetical protein F6K58_04560 [Symploca sp. SIO2E9]|nr:hypothetical protein [Symploca sp. SIO2E9]
MFTIDLTLKNTSLPLSVQRNSAEEAQETYQEVISAMRSPEASQLVELSCHKQPEKKIAILSNQISAVMISQKSGTAAGGRTPGFFAVAEAE